MRNSRGERRKVVRSSSARRGVSAGARAMPLVGAARRRVGTRKNKAPRPLRPQPEDSRRAPKSRRRDACSGDSVSTDDCHTTRLFPMVNILRSRGRRPPPGWWPLRLVKSGKETKGAGGAGPHGNEQDVRGRSLRFYKNARGSGTPLRLCSECEGDGWIFSDHRGDLSRGGGN